MTTPRIAIIISSTRQARLGEKVAQWVLEHAAARTDLAFELVDLREVNLPFFDEVASNAWAPSTSEAAQAWQKTVGSFDGYIFVTAEYNHSITAALKNALDYASPEWNKKPAAAVGYGGVGGARAVEHLRGIAVELQMAPTRTAVHIGGADFIAIWQQGVALNDLPHLLPTLNTLFDELSWWATALKTAREQA